MSVQGAATTATEAGVAANHPNAELVVGSSQLFQDNELRYVPMPTPDPKDPLNLPEWRKWVAIMSLCFFGSLGLTIEGIIAGLLPVFYFDYNGVSTEALQELFEMSQFVQPDGGSSGGGGNSGGNPMSFNILEQMATWESTTPLWKVAMLGTVPLIFNGVSSFFLVPLSSAIGRRPVLLTAGTLAWIGGIWAMNSKGLPDHIGARCLQALGAGAVEAMIPLIIQDMTFIHQRSTALATLNASQGVLILGLGMLSPVIAFYKSWRILYLILSMFTLASWIGVFLCVPETRRERSNDELAGQPVYTLRSGEVRPRLDSGTYGPRTLRSNFGVLNVPIRWDLGKTTLFQTLKCILFPTVAWATLLTGVLSGAGTAMAQTTSVALLLMGWDLRLLGMAGLAMLCATPFTWLIAGWAADKVCNLIARARNGRREPEMHLVNIIFPTICAVLGIVVYGYIGDHIRTIPRPDYALLAMVSLHTLGSACINTTLQVFLLESFPSHASPILIVYSSIRLLLGFVTAFQATQWVKDMGFLPMYGIYGGIILILALFGLPVLLLGRKLRTFAVGTVDNGQGFRWCRINWRPWRRAHPDEPLTSNPPTEPPPRRMEPRDEPPGYVILRSRAPFAQVNAILDPQSVIS